MRRSSLSSTIRIRCKEPFTWDISMDSNPGVPPDTIVSEHSFGVLGEMNFALCRWLFPFGKVTCTQVPSCSVLWIWILPLCNLTSLYTSIRPIPLPVTFKLMTLLPRKQFLNNFFCSHEGMPIPVSFTSMLQEFPSSQA